MKGEKEVWGRRVQAGRSSRRFVWKNLTNLSTCRLGKDLRDSAGNSRNFVGAVNKLFQYRANTLREMQGVNCRNVSEICRSEICEGEQ